MSSIKRVFVIGSTGSIGTNVLGVMESLNRIAIQADEEPPYQVVGLAARQNGRLLHQQMKIWSPLVVSIEDSRAYDDLKGAFPEKHVHRNMGEALRSCDFDLLVNSVVGGCGLEPTMMALERGVDVALANKETLVSGGALVMEALKRSGSRLIPIDSEHAALMSLLDKVDKQQISKVMLTASGGPFFKHATPSCDPSIQEVTSHPTWRMGQKISVDSATMMNKGFEIIEAHHLFGLPYERIEAIIHPESYLHALVQTVDGALYGHMSVPDMRLAIQNALTWPKIKSSGVEPLDLTQIRTMHFYSVDVKRYPLFDLALACGKEGGSLATVLNAANDMAVMLFLQGKINYKMLFSVIHRIVSNYSNRPISGLEDVLALNREVKRQVLEDVRRNGT